MFLRATLALVSCVSIAPAASTRAAATGSACGQGAAGSGTLEPEPP